MATPIPTPKPVIAILGAGITGLQTALSILTSLPSYSVIIIAQHFPNDSDQKSIDYTSPWAGGHWRSYAHSGPEDEECRAWDERTYREWRQLLAEGKVDAKPEEGGAEKEKLLGLGIREGIVFWSVEMNEAQDANGGGLWWHDMVSGFRVLRKEELAQARRGQQHESEVEGQGIAFGVRYDTVCINVPRYLRYLVERVTALGGTFIKARVDTVDGLEGVVDGVMQLISDLEKKQQHHQAFYINAIVLATGLLSKNFLPKEEAEKLYPVRGQTVLVKGEASRSITHLFKAGDISYAIPRPGSGVTILGGCRDVGNWDEKEDVGVTEKILRRAKALVPELLGKDGEFEVLSVQVGRRPGRKGASRVEMERERVRGVRVVHAYGHEGAGYQNSVGSAEKVVSLLVTI